MNNNLTSLLWNAPAKPYHLKPINASHHTKRTNSAQFKMLPQQQQKKNIFICNHCAQLVVWAESKSGKKYLCDVEVEKQSVGKFTSKNFYFFPHLFHNKSCQPTEDGSVHPKVWQYQQQQETLIKKANQQ